MRESGQVTLYLVVGLVCTVGALLQGCSTSRVPAGPGAAQEFDDHGTTLVPAHPGAPRGLAVDPVAKQVPIFDEERLLLTSAYSREHYGTSTFELTAPQMIVVHYTAIPTLKETLQFFKPSRLDRQSREDIAHGGDVNVSAHYVVDTDGELYQLAPEDVICRHTIGFNHTAIGIENVAGDADHLTDKQAEATAGLISRIIGRHPTIRYLIGHDEYRNSSLPHYRLLVEHDASYRFTDKIDPGPAFMARVRRLLKEVYGITLAD